MTIKFTLNAELVISDLELQELECVHNHGHEDHGDKHCHHHGDDNSLGSLKGNASLKFDCGLDFDMSPEELKAAYNMVTAIGGKFAEAAAKTKDLGERVCSKINQQAETEKPKLESETKSIEDEGEDKASFEIEAKAEMKKASSILSDEEAKAEPEIEQIDWARLKLDSVARTLRRAQRSNIEIDPELLEEYRKLRCKLANLNGKC